MVLQKQSARNFGMTKNCWYMSEFVTYIKILVRYYRKCVYGNFIIFKNWRIAGIKTLEQRNWWHGYHMIMQPHKVHTWSFPRNVFDMLPSNPMLPEPIILSCWWRRWWFELWDCWLESGCCRYCCCCWLLFCSCCCCNWETFNLYVNKYSQEARRD